MLLDQLFCLQIDKVMPQHGRRQSLLGVRSVNARLAGGLIIVLMQVFLVILISVLDCWTKHLLSLALFYQIPVAVAAWRGGFPCGVFLSLFATLSWHVVDQDNNQNLPLLVSLWNGVVRFSIFTMTS